jgi:hypothetical protein
MQHPPDAELSKWLKKSAEISAQRGYHGKGSQNNRSSLTLSGSTDSTANYNTTSPPSVSPRGNPWTNNASAPHTPQSNNNLKRSQGAKDKNSSASKNNNSGGRNIRKSTNNPYSDNNHNNGAYNNTVPYYQHQAYYAPTDPTVYYNNTGYNPYYDNTNDMAYYNTEYYDNEYYNQGGYYDALANSNYMLDFSSVPADSTSDGNSSENSSENGDWQEVSYKKPPPSTVHVHRGRGRGQLKRPQNKRQ